MIPADVLASLDAQTSEARRRSSCLTTQDIVERALKEGVMPFLNQYGNPFVHIPVKEPTKHWETLEMSSETFSARMLDLMERYTGSLPTVSDIRNTVAALKLLAVRSGRRRLANRFVADGDEIFIDFGDESWEMIQVGPGGWKICPQDQPRFFRVRHQKPLCRPEQNDNSDPTELFKHVSVTEDGQQLLLLSQMASAFCPNVPSPITIFTGEQGSSKTTGCLRLRSLIDPSEIPLLGDIEMGNLAQVLHHHAFPCFENVSSFTRRQSDLLCRAATGNGIEKRKLFTDSDQTIYSFRRSILINGIGLPSARPDLLDRCIVFECKRLDSFKPLRELDREFEEARPKILGALLDLLVETLKRVPTTDPTGDFRMADFALFGRAVARALGRRPEEFDEAYRANILHRGQYMVEGCLVAQMIRELVTSHPATHSWSGTATCLLKRLTDLASRSGMCNWRRGIPGSARHLSTRLSELASVMVRQEIVIRKLPRTNEGHQWEISRTPVESSVDLDAVRRCYEGGKNDE